MRDWVRSWSATARLIGVGLSVVVAFVGAIWVLNHLSAHLIHSLFPARYVRLGEAILDTCVACVAALVMYLLLLRHLVLWKKVKRQERRWEDLREHEMEYERGMDTGATEKWRPLGDVLFGDVHELELPGDAGVGEKKRKKKKKAAQAEIGEPKEANYVNFSFLDTTDDPFRPLKRNEGLYTNLVYKFVVSIGFTPDERFEGVEKQPSLVRPPEKEMLILDVALVLPDNVKILGSPWAVLQWPADGPSTVNAEFDLKARAKGEARLKVLIFYDHDLLFCGDIKMQVAAEGDEWTEKQPIGWMILDSSQLSLFRSFKALDRDGRRKLNISVHQPSPNEYALVFFFRSCRGNLAVYPLTVTFPEDQIRDFLAKTRSALRLLLEDPQFGRFHQNAEGYDGRYRTPAEGASPEEALAHSRAQQMLRDIAVVGRDLWSKIFGSHMGSRMAGMLAEELKEDGAIVQVWIAPDARDFILPWVWLYPPEAENEFNRKNFWGYKFIIEQVRQKRASLRPASVISADSIRVASALHNFTTRSRQREFFTSYKTRYDPAFKWLDIAPDECRAYLPKCDSHILYFYCHGHTEKQVKTDYEGLLKFLKKAHADDEAEAARMFEIVAIQQRQQIRDSSYIQIENTILKMSDINQFAPTKSNWPLVFLNICESAEFYPGSDNLIDAFLDRDAGGVIGTEMPMLTVFGDLMARRFFESYFSPNPQYEGPGSEGRAIGRVLWQLRRDFLDQGNPLAFAYTYFGDATTRFRPAVAHETAKTSASSV